jgi:hypothetical protein
LEQHTLPAIRDAICHGFFSWLESESGRNTRDIPPLPQRDTEVMKVYDNQTDIGWQHFARGRMVIEWGTMINNHLATQRRYNFNAELGVQSYYPSTGNTYSNYGSFKTKRCMVKHQRWQ